MRDNFQVSPQREECKGHLKCQAEIVLLVAVLSWAGGGVTKSFVTLPSVRKRTDTFHEYTLVEGKT